MVGKEDTGMNNIPVTLNKGQSMFLPPPCIPSTIEMRPLFVSCFVVRLLWDIDAKSDWVSCTVPVFFKMILLVSIGCAIGYISSCFARTDGIGQRSVLFVGATSRFGSLY